MLVDPASARILSVKPMAAPENNDVVTRALADVLPLYPHLNTLIMDRVCGYKRAAGQNPNLSQLKFFIVDWFHARGHVGGCQCNPRTNKALGRRLGSLNTSICEQTFSWFRKYSHATTLASHSVCTTAVMTGRALARSGVPRSARAPEGAARHRAHYATRPRSFCGRMGVCGGGRRGG